AHRLGHGTPKTHSAPFQTSPFGQLQHFLFTSSHSFPGGQRIPLPLAEGPASRGQAFTHEAQVPSSVQPSSMILAVSQSWTAQIGLSRWARGAGGEGAGVAEGARVVAVEFVADCVPEASPLGS